MLIFICFQLLLLFHRFFLFIRLVLFFHYVKMGVECFFESVKRNRVWWQLNLAYMSRMDWEQVTHLECEFYVRLLIFVNCLKSAHYAVSENVLVKYVTSACKVKCSVGLFWSWIKIFEMCSHRSFNLISKVVFAEAFVNLVNWTRTVFLKTSKLVRISRFWHYVLFNNGCLNGSCISRVKFSLCCLFQSLTQPL